MKPGFSQADPKIDEIANVTLGLSNYSYLTNMQTVGRLMRQRKLVKARLLKATKEKQQEKLKT